MMTTTRLTLTMLLIASSLVGVVAATISTTFVEPPRVAEAAGPIIPVPSPLRPVRSVVNPSFETFEPAQQISFGFAESLNGHQIDPTSLPYMVGWQTTHPARSGRVAPIEVWGNTFTNGANPGAFDGFHFVELNAFVSSALYQDLCVLPNDDVGFSVRHHSRGGGPERIFVSITDPDAWTGRTPPTDPAAINYRSPNFSTTRSQGWDEKTGNWLNDGSTSGGTPVVGARRFAFAAVDAGSIGNFIDQVQLNLPPVADFLEVDFVNNINTGTPEADGNIYLSMAVNGTIPATGATIDFTLEDGPSGNGSTFTADEYTIGGVFNGEGDMNAGITVTGPVASVYTLNIPPGVYDPNRPDQFASIQVIPNLANLEPVEQPELSILGSAGVQIADAECQTPEATLSRPLVVGEAVGLAKNVSQAPLPNGDGTSDLEYTLHIENISATNMTLTSLIDDLDATFTAFGATVQSVGPVTSPDGIPIDPGWNGTSVKELVAAPTHVIPPGATHTIVIPLTVNPGSTNVVFNNTAVVEVTTDSGTLTDGSTDGTDPDPDDNAQPNDNSVPTPVTIVPVGPFPFPTGTPLQDLFAGQTTTIRECGVDITMTTVDGDPSAFANIVGFAGDGTLSQGLHVSRQPFGAADGGFSSSFTLQFSRPILGLTLRFQSQQTEEVFRFSEAATSVTAEPNTPYGAAVPILSQVALANGGTELRSTLSDAYGSGTSESFGSNSLVTWDFPTPISTLTVAHDGPGLDPSNTNGSTVHNGTIVVAGEVDCEPLVDRGGIAKRASEPIPNADGSYTVTYSYVVENLGNTRLDVVEVRDVMTGRFGTYTAGTPTGPGQYTVADPVITINSGDPLAPDPAFTGEGSTTNLLLSASGSIAARDVVEVAVDVTFIPNFGSNPVKSVFNLATLEATGEVGGALIVDTSVDGDDPDPNGDGTPSEIVATQVVVRAAEIELDKRAGAHDDTDLDGLIDAGETIAYEFEVTNRSLPLAGVMVTDALITDAPNNGVISCPSASIANNSSLTCTAVYTVTQTDVDAGLIDNRASVEGQGGGFTVTDEATEQVPIAQIASVDIGKRFTGFTDNDASADITLGDTLTYELTVTNSGNITLDDFDVTDPAADTTPGVVCAGAPGALGGGESFICTAQVTVSPAQAAAGRVDNTAAVTADDPADNEVSDSDDATVLVEQNPSITLDKRFGGMVDDVDASGTVSDGDTIRYDFVVTNDGDVPLTGLTVSDVSVPLLPGTLSSVSCPSTTLAISGAAATTTCTATYVVTSDDVINGSIVNTADASAESPTAVVVNDSDTETVTVPQNPSILLDKRFDTITSGDGDTLVEAGETIRYEFTITNNGNLPLTGVTLTDPLVGLVPSATAGITCGVPNLAVGASTTCTATYVVPTPAPLGGVVNDATVRGSPPAATGLADVTDSDRETVATAENPAVTVVKTLDSFTDADGSTDITIDDVLRFDFEVTNTGDTPLAGLAVTDVSAPALPGTLSSVDCGGIVTLTVGQTINCSATYNVTQADVDVGTVVNTVRVDAQSPGGLDVFDTDVETVTPARNPSISIVKSLTANADADASGDVSAGDVLTYTFTVDNTGNTTLNAVAVTDPLTGFSGACNAISTLAPGASTTCSDTYTVTQLDVDAGRIDNTADVAASVSGGGSVSDTDDETVAPTQTPGISIAKSLTSNSDPDGSASVTRDDVLTYTLVVTNTGTVTLTDVTVSDPLLGLTDETCNAVTTLAPGADTTCAFTLIATQTHVDAGRIDNTATVTATPPIGGDIGDADVETLLIPPVPAINVVKSVLGGVPLATDVDVGDDIVFEFRVTNTGNVTLTSVAVTDPLPGLAPPTCPLTTLEPGASTTCTSTYRVIQDDVDAGSIDNSATATGVPPGATPAPVSDPSAVTIPIAPAPAVELEKTIASVAPSPAALGSDVTYSFRVTNRGNVSLDTVTVIDPLVGAVNCPGAPAASLLPGDSIVCTAAPYEITQPDVDAGQRLNSATVRADSPQGSRVSDDDDERLVIAQSPAISVGKSAALTIDADASSDLSLGDTITYTFTVTNSGDVTLGGVALADQRAGYGIDVGGVALAPTGCGLVVLAPAQSTNCAVDYVVTAADVAAGQFDNTADAQGTAPDGTVVRDDGTTSVVPQQNPSITLAKRFGAIADDADNSGTVSNGDTVRFEFTVTNDGDVPLTGVAVTDTSAPALPGSLSAVACPTTVLPVAAPANSMICTADYAVTLQDVINGSIDNTARVEGTSPAATAVADTASVAVTVAQNPSLQIDKSFTTIVAGDGDTDVEAGETIQYTFTVTNNGNLPLTGITVLDPLDGLVPSAYGTGVPCNATNTGAIDLAVGASTTCTATYVVPTPAPTAIVNVATATGNPPASTGLPATTDTDGETVTSSANPSVRLTKTLLANADEDTSGDITLGDTLTFAFDVVNSGDTVLTSVAVVDTSAPALDGTLSAIDCGGTDTLQPAGSAGDSVRCTADYVVTQVDVDSGTIVNSAVVTALGAGQNVSDTDTEVVQPAQNPGISITKSFTADSTAGDVVEGDTLTYTFVVTNTGNTTLDAVVVRDPLTGFNGSCGGVDSLGPGLTTTCTDTLLVSPADIAVGTIDNTATVTGTYPPNDLIVTDSDDERVTLTQNPSIAVTKTVLSVSDPDASATVTAGDEVTYRFEIVNTGDSTLTDIVLDDPRVGFVGARCGLGAPFSLAPAATSTCTATSVVSQDDVDAGRIDNTVTVSGLPPAGARVSDSDAQTITIPADARIEVVKSVAGGVPGTVVAGDTITFLFDVTNAGNVTLTDIEIDDSLPGLPAPACPTTPLLPGASAQCSAGYVVTQDDVDAGRIANTARASATPPAAVMPLVSDPADVEIDIPAMPAIALEKSLRGGQPAAPLVGDVFTYDLEVTNTGNVTLDALSFTEDLDGVSLVDCGGVDTLAPSSADAPGESVTCSATYVIGQADIDRGVVVNRATAFGSPPTGPRVDSIVSGTSTDLPRNPSLRLVKSIDGGVPEAPAAGDTLTYSFAVTNDGNETLTDIAIDDPLPGLAAPTCPLGPLAPRDSITCLADYVITQADLDAGEFTNVAAATGASLDAEPGDPLVRSAPDSVTVAARSGLGVDKRVVSVGAQRSDGAYDVAYEIDVANRGETTLRNVQVSDDLASTFADAFAVAVVSLTSSDFTVTRGATDGSALLDGTDSLAPRARGSIQLVVRVTPTASFRGPFLNTAVLTAAGAGDVELSDTSGASVEFSRGFDLALAKSVDLDRTAVGSAVFDLVVSNAGDEDAQLPITVTDEIPAGLGSAVAEAPDGVTCSVALRTLTCSFDEPLRAGEAATITLVTSIDPDDTPGDIVNTASVSGSVAAVFESVGADNHSAAVLRARFVPAVEPQPPDSGDDLPDTGSGGLSTLLRAAAVATLLGAALLLLRGRRFGRST